MLDLLKKFALEGKLVVVTGAGISKGFPSYVPSWWEYNKMLLKIMGECGAEALGMKGNLLELDRLEEYLPIVTVSELILDRFAGESYYSLIELLEASVPNENHLMMAKLSKDDILRACITTNFDTLIERAFCDLGVPLTVCDNEDEFAELLSGSCESCSLLKIHGSVVNTQYAIDTVRQKVKGLSSDRKAIIKALFEENHVLFLGFSGDDFLIDSDYIPISSCKKGISWIAYPGSKLNSVIEEYSKKDIIEVAFMTLPDFYQEMEWSLDNEGKTILKKYSENPGEADFIDKNAGKIRDYYVFNGLKWGCVAACLELNIYQNDNLAERICREIKNRTPMLETIQPLDYYKCPALTSVINYEIIKNNLKDAESICVLELLIMRTYADSIIQNNGTISAVRNMCFNYATVDQSFARIMLANNKYEEALAYYTNCLLFAYKGHTYQTMSSAILGIALCEHRLSLRDGGSGCPDTLYKLHAARNLAIEGGFIDALIFADEKLVYYYAVKEDYVNSRKYFQEINKYEKLATQQHRVNVIIEELKNYLLPYAEETGSNIEKRYFSIEKAYAWDPFTLYPVIQFQEGRVAKELYETEGFEKAYEYLSDACQSEMDAILDGKSIKYDKKTISLLDCYSSFLKIVRSELNAQGVEDLDEINNKIRTCSDYILEYNLRTFNYVDFLSATAETACQYAITAVDEKEYQIAEFAAKICKVMHPEFCNSVQYAIAVYALYIVSIKQGKDNEANKYAKEFVDLPEEVTETFSPGLRDVLLEWMELDYE